MSYPSITQATEESYYEILWAENSVADLGHQPTSNYGSGIDDPQKQAIITQ